jgi:uncharacterized Tic20 family protein
MAETNETPKPAETPGGGAVSKDAKMWGMLCHLLGLFTSFVGPLIIWLLKKEEDPFIDDQGKEALNFQITVLIASIVSGLLCVVCIGVFLAIAVGIVDLIFCIMATVKANGGEAYRYPVSIRLIK